MRTRIFVNSYWWPRSYEPTNHFQRLSNNWEQRSGSLEHERGTIGPHDWATFQSQVTAVRGVSAPTGRISSGGTNIVISKTFATFTVSLVVSLALSGLARSQPA